MKQHSDIRSLLLPWIERTLDEQGQELVGDHLGGCSSCRQYFEMMSLALLPASNPGQDTLVPDPYLPTRVKALVEQSLSDSRSRKSTAVRWALRTAAFLVAVVFGVYLGEKLSYQTSTVTDQHIIAEYAESIQASGIGDRWQSVAQSAEEGSK